MEKREKRRKWNIEQKHNHNIFILNVSTSEKSLFYMQRTDRLNAVQSNMFLLFTVLSKRSIRRKRIEMNGERWRWYEKKAKRKAIYQEKWNKIKMKIYKKNLTIWMWNLFIFLYAFILLHPLFIEIWEKAREITRKRISFSFYSCEWFHGFVQYILSFFPFFFSCWRIFFLFLFIETK